MEKPKFRETEEGGQDEDFWENFKRFAREMGFPEEQVDWHVKWGKKLQRSLPGKKLEEISAKEVREFIESCSPKENRSEWIIERVKGAMRLLFRGYLKVPWASKPEKAPPARFKDETSGKDFKKAGGKIIQELRSCLRVRHYSLRTEQAYEHWLKRFLVFQKGKPIEELQSSDVKDYLEYLATERKVAANTQNQALNSLLFVFEQVLRKPLEIVEEFTRAKRPKRLPVVLSKQEVAGLLKGLSEPYDLMGGLL